MVIAWLPFRWRENNRDDLAQVGDCGHPHWWLARPRAARADGEIVLVARRIIELASAGERDADRLAARTLAEFGVANDGTLWRH
jgi:hypothetical protein